MQVRLTAFISGTTMDNVVVGRIIQFIIQLAQAFMKSYREICFLFTSYVTKVRLVLLRHDPDLKGYIGGKRHKSQKPFVLIDDALPIMHLIFQNVAIYTLPPFVIIPLRFLFSIPDVVRDDASCYYLRMRMDQRGTCHPAMITKNDDHHVLTFLHEIQVAPVISLNNHTHFFN